MQNKNKKTGNRLPIAILIIGVLSLGIFLVLLPIEALPNLVCFALSLAFFLIGSGLYAYLTRDASNDAEATFGRSLGQIMLEIVIKMRLPMVICDTGGKIIWRNRAFGEATESIGSVMGVELDTISSISLEELSEESGCDVELCDRCYRADAFAFKTDEKNYWFIVFSDRTEYNRLTEMVENERSIIAYILIDNLDELSRHVQDFGSEVNDIAGILRDFAASLDGVLREYDRNKYLLITNRAGLNRCIADNFSILDKVREVRIGDMGLPITISMGIADTGTTLRDREAGAREALGMALARGGDQVVYKTDDALNFYGGNTRPVQKRSSVAAKVRSCELVAHISRASNVIIMGHGGADQDCFGASVGIARLAMFCFIKPYIVVDKSDPNTQSFLAKFKNIPEYADVFVTADDAQDLVTGETLLVIVDVNNVDHMLSPGLALSVGDALIIDHHRKTDPHKRREWLAEYIEPSASSASELITEVLQYFDDAMRPPAFVCSALLAGITVDTKHFAFNVGSRTFEAAGYLRRNGADISMVKQLFQDDMESFTACAQTVEHAELLGHGIARSSIDGYGRGSKLIAAKAADQLIGIRGIEAAFVIGREDGTLYVSGRSLGRINVQLVCEKLGGGGHLTMAGAQLFQTDDMEEAKALVRESIAEYQREANV